MPTAFSPAAGDGQEPRQGYPKGAGQALERPPRGRLPENRGDSHRYLSHFNDLGKTEGTVIVTFLISMTCGKIPFSDNVYPY
jgi:hypothetical protein